MSKNRAVRIALSLFIVFHVFCILLAPNSLSYLGARFGPIVGPYVNFLEIGSTWGFFAPNPGPPPVFIEYEAVGDGGEPFATGTWPEKVSPFSIRERQTRRLSVARFLMPSPERIEKIMGPYYCRVFPKAQSIRLWRVVRGMANLHDVVDGKRSIDDGVGTERKWITQYLCPGRV